VSGTWRAPCLDAPSQLLLLAGREHGRTIPLTDIIASNYSVLTAKILWEIYYEQTCLTGMRASVQLVAWLGLISIPEC
jgi:hypothetical protein